MIYVKLNTLCVTNYADISILLEIIDFQDSTPLNLNGYTVHFTVKQTLTGVVKISKTVTNHLEPLDGQTLVEITKEDIETLEPGKYIYEVKLEDSDNKLTDFGQSDFIIEQSLKTA